MPSSVPVPAAEMTQSSDPQPGDPAARTADAAEPAGRAPGLLGRARAAARPVSSTGPLITIIVLLAGAVGGLVLRDLNSLKADIVKFETEMDAKFVRLETEMDAKFVKLDTNMDTRFAAQDDKIDEINLKLTALIAALNKTEEVDAALTGRLLDPGADPAEPRSAQPQADATAAEAGGSTGGGRAPASTG